MELVRPQTGVDPAAAADGPRGAVGAQVGGAGGVRGAVRRQGARLPPHHDGRGNRHLAQAGREQRGRSRVSLRRALPAPGPGIKTFS